MNNSVKNIFFALGATAILASCGENAWNDHLDGFEPGTNYNTAIEGEFTMSAADYNAVASNATNKSLAEAAGVANDLKAVGTNGIFTAKIPAKEYLPAYLASSSAPYFLAPEGSKINVTYQETGETAPIIAQIAGARTYTVSKDDYKSAWGSDKDYIDAFAPMTPAANKIPAILKEVFDDAATGEYAVVSYNESATNPIFISDSEVEEFTGGFFFLVADGSNGAGPIDAGKGYGYLPLAEMTVADGAVNTSGVNAFNFVKSANGFYIKDAYGRYLYQKGTYNSFNLSATLPESGAEWTVAVASNGQATITNIEVGKWIQYDSNYSSWGSYAEAKGSLPVLYQAQKLDFYLVNAEGHGAGVLASDKKYGYLPNVDMTVENGIVTNADPANAYTFEVADGGYYIKDSYGRYLYQAGTYNSFNLSEGVPEAGGVWTLTENAEGNVTITNKEIGKWIQYDGNYSSWGSYDSEKGTLPRLINAAATPAAANRPAKVVAGTPVASGMTAVYTFDGSKWAEATDVTALDAADYAAMGFDNNKLENPETYLPLYLKAKQPYAVAGDEMAVVYNGTSCTMCVYDGQNWTVNDNDLQVKTAQFVHNAQGWSFVKYVGKAYFKLASEIVLDRQYLMVAEGICAIPLVTSKTYGYLNTASVVDVNGVIEQKNEANAFTFAGSYTAEDGTTYKAAEGTFLIKDSNGRYLYMTGTFNSFNVADAPAIADGAIDPAYTFKGEINGDGNCTITNVGNSKWIQYSTTYTSWGCYSNEQGVLPTLYMLAAE